MTSVLGKGRRDIEPTICLYETGMDCEKVPTQGHCGGTGSNSHAPVVLQATGSWPEGVITDEPYD